MKTHNKRKPKVILIGGTYRAYITFQNLIKRKDVNYCQFICMKGLDSNENKYVLKIRDICKKNKIPFSLCNKINKKLAKIIKNHKADFMLGIGIWRSIVEDNILNYLKIGYLAVHGSPLPKYRGWAPINWQIINGEKNVILRAFKLNKYIDAGQLLLNYKRKYLEAKINIENDKHLDEILVEYDKKHIELNNKIIDLVLTKKLILKDQNNNLATYTCNRNKNDSLINWNDNSMNVFNFIRAQNIPNIGAYTFYNKKKIYIWRVKIKKEYKNYVGRIPGKVIKTDFKSVIILTKDSAIEVLEASHKKLKKLNNIFHSVKLSCK